MGDTKIDWSDKVWNPVSGCTPVSAGCKNCYAKRMAKRLKGMGTPGYENEFEVTLHLERLNEPLKWKKPRRVFVCSMGDLFHKDVPFEFIEKVFSIIYDSPHHTFMILTKRPERMKLFFENPGARPMAFLSTALSIPHNNLYLGVSVEDQATADERIPLLLQTPAAKRFISYEPALGPIAFSETAGNQVLNPECWGDCACDSLYGYDPGCRRNGGDGILERRIDQVIMGGETGPGARPLHPDWARSMRDQCAEAGVPFFFKSWGVWKAEVMAGTEVCLAHLKPGQIVGAGDGRTNHTLYTRVGKKNTGHLIDGKEHRELI